MITFVNFLLNRVYNNKPIPSECIDIAFEKTIADIKYHFNDLSENNVKDRIISNSNELAVFLYRLGSELHEKKMEDEKKQIHWLLKEICSCEIYFNTIIDVGFYIVHGQGTVVGSRNKIGKGFIIHQGCTIGHKKNGQGAGNVIGNNVTMYCNSSIIGELNIGNNVVIGGHVMVTSDVTDNKIVLNQSKPLIKELLF